MRSQLLDRFVRALLVASVLGASVATTSADEGRQPAPRSPQELQLTDKDGQRQGESGLEAAGRLLRQMTSFRANSHERNHTRVRAAFREVVRQPARSTVRVYSDGDHVALGAIISPDGFVLTKASELYGAIQCGLADGKRLDAEFVGHHRDSDLALLKLDADNLSAFELRESSPVEVGSWVITSDIQGGPAAIGVLSVKARPIKSEPALLGVQLQDSDQGPQVTFVMPDSAAQDAGVEVNDVITHVNGETMNTQRELVEKVRTFLPGERIRLRVKRGESFKLMSPILGSLSSVNRRQHIQNRLGGPELSRRNKGFPAALQHDTALHPYQCGGPLVDLDGNLLGINIAHTDRVSSLALPTSVILPLLEDLKSGKLRPSPVPSDSQIALQNRAEELRQVVGAWTKKLSELQETLRLTADAEAEALKAAESAPDALESAESIKEARAAKQEAERALEEAKLKLEEVTSELKQVESKVAMQTD